MRIRALARKALPGMLSAIGVVAPATASAAPFDPSGVLRLVRPAHAQLNTNQSSNWFGYGQGAFEHGGALFSSVTADWVVPAASQHKSGQAGSSATWIGIGGGCVDAGCALGDATLIQTGTEQDVDSSGHPSYSAWWELVPAPATTISNFKVLPGDRVHASVAETTPNSEIWAITLNDLTQRERFSTTVAYSSTHTTAEWIEETPLTISSSGTGEASLPNLTSTVFANATVNGAAAHLTASEEVQLVDASNTVIGSPSAPDAKAAGFAACAWSTHCALPPAPAPPRATGKRPRPRHPARPRHRKHNRR